MTNRHPFAVLKEFTAGMAKRRLITYAAAGAYYMFLSFVPFVMLLCSALPLSELSQDTMLEVLRENVPAYLAELVERIVDSVYGGSPATLTISVVLTVLSATSAIRALIRGVDAAYDVRRRCSIVTFYFRSFFYMFILLFVILLTLSVMVYGGRILSLLGSRASDVPALDFLFFLLRYLGFAFVMLFLTLVFDALNKWMPSSKNREGAHWPGALFSALVWVIFSSAFSFYLSVSGNYGAYGIIGTVMVAMIWMYFCLYFLLIGAFLNRFLDLRRNKAES
jgi:membrane protein